MRVLLGLLAVVAMLASMAKAEVITCSDIADSYVKGPSTYYGKTYNYGAAANLYATSIGAPTEEHILMKFDLSALPAGSTIDAATLKVFTPTAGSVFTVYRMTREGWVEGTKDGAATTDSVNWMTYDGTHSWTTLGGDYDNTVSAVSSASIVGAWLNIDVKSLVSSMVGQTTGSFLIVSNTTNTANGRISARGTANPPSLAITYSVPEPATMTLLALGGLSLLARRRNRA